MEDDEPRPRKKYPLSISKLSKTPSWIMLGFALGALFVIALPPLTEDKPRPEPPKPVEQPKAEPAPPQLTTIEAVFDDPRWREYVHWWNDTTEVALWNNGTREFSDYYEVRRIDGVYYFRSLPSLSRPLVNLKPPPPTDCPLRFTASIEEVFHGGREPPRPERNYRPAPQRAPAVNLPKPQVDAGTTPTPPRIEVETRPLTPPDK